MLSIDEAIEKYRKMAKTQKTVYDACILKECNKHILREAEDHEQIAELLEELKELREKSECARCVYNCGCIDEIAYKTGYNKAIDDFVNTVKATFPHDNIAICNTEVIAKKLTAGEENER